MAIDVARPPGPSQPPERARAAAPKTARTAAPAAVAPPDAPLAGLLARAVLARRDVAAALHEKEGYKRLTPDWKSTLDALAKGATPATESAPKDLGKLLDTAGPAGAETATFKRFVRDGAYLNYNTLIPENWDRAAHMRPHEVGRPTRIAKHPFRRGEAPALRFPVTIHVGEEKLVIPVFEPVHFVMRGIDVLPRPAAVAAALAQLPSESLELIKAVHLNPVGAEDRPPGATGPATFMSTDRSGEVQVYPHSSGYSDRRIVSSLIHETGHLAALRAFGSRNDPNWEEWKAAMEADHVSVSEYGTTRVPEDFAESWTLWMPVRGTPGEDDVVALIPNRVRLMRELVRRKARLDALAEDLLSPAPARR